jgi:hypothetical protein
MLQILTAAPTNSCRNMCVPLKDCVTQDQHCIDFQARQSDR